MARKTPKTKEESLEGIRKALERVERTDERPSNITSFTSSLKYNLTGVTPDAEMEEGGFFPAVKKEFSRGFKEMFGFRDKGDVEKEQTLKEEAQKAQEAEKKKIEEQNEKMMKTSDEMLLTNKKMLDELTVLRQVTEGRVSYSEKSGRYHSKEPGKKGQYISNETMFPASISSGTVVEEDDTQSKMLEKLQEIDENTEEAAETNGGMLNGLMDFFGPATKALTAIGPALSSIALPLATIAATIWAGKKVKEAVTAFGDMREAQRGAEQALEKEQQGEANARAIFEQKDPELLKKADELRAADANAGQEDKGLGYYLGQARVQLGRTVGAAATPTPPRVNATAAVEQSSMQPNAAAPVVVNNVANNTTAPTSSSSSGAVVVSLRDIHGSHLRFQERRLTRVV